MASDGAPATAYPLSVVHVDAIGPMARSSDRTRAAPDAPGRASVVKSKKTLSVAIAILCTAALVSSCGSSSSASASTAPLGVTWMAGYAAPGTPAKYNKVGVIKIGPSSAKNVLVLEPGTSAGSAYFVPLAQWIVSKTQWLAGLVRRAPGEPARGPVGAEPVQAGQGHGSPAVRLLPRLPEGSEHHPSLPDDPELDGRVRQAMGNERGGAGPARGDRGGQEARRQGRPGWPLARRIGGHRLCHLGLQRSRRRRRPGRPGLHRRRQRPEPGEHPRRPPRSCSRSMPPVPPPGWPSAGSRRPTPESSTPPDRRARSWTRTRLRWVRRRGSCPQTSCPPSR